MFSKIRLIFISFAFVVIFGTFSDKAYSDARIEKVVVSGFGLNESKAIKNASRTAVQHVVGMYVVSDTILENSRLIKDEVLSHSNAYVKSFKILNKQKDEDGLIEIEAAVEVEVGKLTNKLGKLNIAVKKIKSEEVTQFLAIQKSKSSKIKDFKKMVERVVFIPLKENKNVYDLKIIEFKQIDEIPENPFIRFKGNELEMLEEDELSPFLVTFSVALNPDYIGLITSFLEKASKKTYSFFKEGCCNVAIIEPETRKKGFNSLTTKTFELSKKEYKQYKKLHYTFLNNYDSYLQLSLVDKSSISYKRLVISNSSHYSPKSDLSGTYTLSGNLKTKGGTEWLHFHGMRTAVR
tara:strand:- start:26 stop:1075 length:1050 start_codon:yes stop_codon:yes gene_type:complete